MTNIASFRSFVMALIIVYGLYGENQYPAYGRAAEWRLEWMIPIVVRNWIATLLICGLWDWLLYFSPWKNRFEPYKMSAEYPSNSQIKHDAIWTMKASFVAAVIEIILCHFWATGSLSFERQLRTSPMKNFLWSVFLTHWRIPHFWVIHRVMHPWKRDGIFDFGKLLYKYVHSLHHKSYNPTAFSGTSMHWVESTLYYTAPLTVLPFGVHPVIAMGIMVDCAVGAWIGHDGFQWPGSGDVYHYLHHAHFECNYASPQVPIDYLVGTFISEKSDLKKIWRKKNEKIVPVHEDDGVDKQE